MSQFSVTHQWQKNLPVELPNLWKVLYYEGIHGHHILFSPEDVQRFESSSQNQLVDVDLKYIYDVGIELLNCLTFREMVDIIDRLDLLQRQIIYRFYKDWLFEINLRLKSEAH